MALEWMANLTSGQRECLQVIGYELASGEIDEDTAREAVVEMGLTAEQAEEYVDMVIEGYSDE